MASIFRPGESPSVLPIKAVPAVDTWLIEFGYGPSPDHLYHVCEIHGVHIVHASLDGGHYVLELKAKRDGTYKATERSGQFILKDGDIDLVVNVGLNNAEVAKVPKGRYRRNSVVPESLFTDARCIHIMSDETGWEKEYYKLAKAQVEAAGENWEDTLKWVRAQNAWEE